MPQYAFPFVVFHGADDTLCDVDGSRQLFARAKVPRARSQTRHMPGTLRAPCDEVFVTNFPWRGPCGGAAPGRASRL